MMTFLWRPVPGYIRVGPCLLTGQSVEEGQTTPAEATTLRLRERVTLQRRFLCSPDLLLRMGSSAPCRGFEAPRLRAPGSVGIIEPRCGHKYFVLPHSGLRTSLPCLQVGVLPCAAPGPWQGVCEEVTG